MGQLRKDSFHLVNLGCAKNLVEGEHLAGLMLEHGWSPELDPQAARVLVVNTCGFIQPAVEEALETILELAQDKRPGQVLAVVGCLVGRYGKKLARSLPEADLLLSPGAVARLPHYLEQPPADRLVMAPPREVFTGRQPRALSTGPGWAYLRLADGCNHRCAYCTIPAIRGRLRSRAPEDLLDEARRLAQAGIRELNLVAQDLTAYGSDLGLEHGLVRLLEQLAAIDELQWIRLLYLHPETLEKTLLELMAKNKKILPYLDLPIQHVSDRVVRLMGRGLAGPELERLIEQIRALVPGVVLRATVMVGHPGEDQAAFDELYDFIARIRFQHLGCFAFQPEPGTRSARLPAPPAELAQERRDAVMSLQQQISRQHLATKVGRVEPLLVLGPHPESDLLWHGRLPSQAPEVDGLTIITSGNPAPGSIVPCRITRAHHYDLEGTLGVQQ